MNISAQNNTRFFRLDPIEWGIEAKVHVGKHENTLVYALGGSNPLRALSFTGL